MSNLFEGTHLSSRTPPYPLPPYTYEGNRMLIVVARTSPDLLRALVPEPLVVNPAGQMFIYVGDLNLVAPVHVGYHEAGIMIPASDGREEGVYLPVLYLDQALPIVVGREVWGYPKFQAVIDLVEEAAVVRASVRSEGTSLIDATLRLGAPVPPANMSPRTMFLLKRIPSVTGPSSLDVRRLTTAVLRDEKCTEMRPGDVTLRLGSTALDPLGTIPLLEVVNGFYIKGGFVLDHGRVVHDYLE
jgi:acetoacetate decarboxylase